MWLQQDGAPPHFHRAVRAYLDATFENKWIRRGAENPWPPRSTDLTPLDYFLWGYVKEKVYVTPFHNLNELEERITTVCRSVTPELLRRVRRSFLMLAN
ncbi:DDE 3 domain containing protein [Asbolus verrucosus]|uniref:DDE 3 domain containing protein n=1 Tax=Asbolus verrucosus TaxID=1661398 RepID=A0A482VEM5_ASBVE|nr:DDE 3 domain containing protein [Asbolus verrucosus]